VHLSTLYDVEQANAMLPLVRDVFARVRPLNERLVELLGRVAQRRGGAARHAAVTPGTAQPGTPAPESPEPSEERELNELTSSIERHLGELIELGVEIKSVDGLVDFRSLHEGREVLLCWRWNEPEVGWYHELDAGFRGRQPIEDPSAFEGDAKH